MSDDGDGSLFDSDDEDERKRKLDDTENGGGDDEEGEVPKKKAREEDVPQKKRGNVFIDDQAERGSDDDDDEGDEDDESKEDRNEYVSDGFVVMDGAEGSDDDDEEGGDGEGRGKQEDNPLKKKKIRERLGRRTGQILDQDDLDLIEENARSAGERYKEAEAPVNEIVPERIKSKKISFRDDEDEDEEGGGKDVNGDEFGSEDGDDFIEDDLGEERQTVRVIRRESRGRGALSFGPSREQMDEAQEIFGEDYDEFEEVDDESFDGDGLDDTRDGGNGEMNAIRAQYEHTELVESFCTDADELLRKGDLPERFIEQHKKTRRVTADERAEEAAWVVYRLQTDRAVDVPSFALEEVTSSIVYVLQFLQDDLVDAPFVWTYRRDYLHPLISRTILWRIYALDDDWLLFLSRRNGLLSELRALQDASSHGLGDVDDEEAGQSELTELEGEIEEAVRQAEEAAIEYTRLRNLSVLNDASSFDRAQEAAALQELEALEENRKQKEKDLIQMKESIRSKSHRKSLSAKYSPEVATKVLHLFPVERYEPLILSLREEMELKDVGKYLTLLLRGCRGQQATGEGGMSKRLRLISDLDDYYRFSSIDKLRSLVETFAVSAADLGDGLRHGPTFKVEPLAPTCSACEAAIALVDDKALLNDKIVLRAVRVIISTEMASEPSLRRAARAMYRIRATVSTFPTSKGILLINPFHPLFGVHYLKDKPLNDFFTSDKTLFARLLRAEAEGLLILTFNMPRPDDGPAAAPFMHDLQLFSQFMPTLAPQDDPSRESRMSWDSERVQILRDCIERHLFPSLEAETRRELVRLSREAIVSECVDKFSQIVRTGPFRDPEKATIRDLLLRCPQRVATYTVACIVSPPDNRGSLCMVVIDKHGVVKAHSVLPERANTQKRERLGSFLRDHRPDVVVLNASGGDNSRALLNMLEKHLFFEVADALEQAEADRGYDSEDDEIGRYSPRAIIARDEVAQIFAVSRRAKLKFPDLEQGVCVAISLARYVQEPLAELCGMWTSSDSTGVFGTEAFYLDLHPLKDLLRGTKGMLLTALQRTLMDAVCDVGVDLNMAMAYDHLTPTLAFVCGLGLRKADSLRQEIRRKLSSVTSRKELLERKLVGKVVYLNSIGFLRVRDENNDEIQFEPFDDTRIHPECYNSHNFADRICADSLEPPCDLDPIKVKLETMRISRKALQQKTEDQMWLSKWEVLVSNGGVGERDMEELNDGLELLELDDYIIDLERKGLGRRRLQCVQIKEELRYPWLDLRRPLIQPTPYETFKMVTKCNDYVLYCGMQVSCRVMDIKEKSASLSVEGTYRGSAFIGNMADYKVGSIYEVLKVGAIKTGVVIGFDRERLQVDVSFKESHLAHSESWWMRERYRDELMAKWWDASDRAKIPFDKFFLEEAALAEYDAATTISKETTAVVQPRSQMTNRLVYHPLFENCTFQQAVNSLRERGVGSVLFRPSSKGPNHISITWAFQEGIFKHIDVVECNKRPGDLGLSSELEITVGHNVKEVFSDLDDIYSGYIQPMNEFTKMITDSSFFFRGPMDQLHAALQLEFQKKPGRTPYFLSVSPTDVGCFLLSWLSLNGPKSIPVVITCKGFRMGGRCFLKVSELLRYFKENINALR